MSGEEIEIVIEYDPPISRILFIDISVFASILRLYFMAASTKAKRREIEKLLATATGTNCIAIKSQQESIVRGGRTRTYA